MPPAEAPAPTRSSQRQPRPVERLDPSQPRVPRPRRAPAPQRQEPILIPEPVRADGDDEEEFEDITARCRPHIPQGDLNATRTPDSDGWCLIAKLGAYESFLTCFSALQEVPEQHEEAFAEAAAEVLRRKDRAISDLETRLALSWWLFLPKALLRRPTRGGRNGRQQVAKRFACMSRGDWGGLIDLWEKDRKILVDKKERRNRRGHRQAEGDDLEKKRRDFLTLISSGQISRAMQRVTSHGLASMDSPAIRQQMESKYPARGRPLPDSVPKHSPIEHLRGLRDSLKALSPGSAPGCGGMRPEYLQTLGHKLEEEDMKRLEEFGLSYLRGDLPHWFYSVWLTVQTVPIFKTAEQTSARPLGLRTPLLKEFHRAVVSQNKQEVRTFLEPQQLGMSVAGAQKLVTSVRALLNHRRDFICVKIDFRNAYNEMSRRAIIEAFVEEPTLRHLAHFCAVTLAPFSGLEAGGQLWGEGGEGATQGDPAASMEFCVGLQRFLVLLDTACKAGGGMARAGADDVTAVGPAGLVLPAVEEFARQVEEHCLLHWEKTKSEVFTWDGDLPPGTPAGLTLAGEEVDGNFEHGFLLYGVPVGSDAFCSCKLMEIAKSIKEDAQKASNLLSSDRQALWSALRCSIVHRFDYWLQLSYPSVVAPVARWLDEELWKILETAFGFHIPKEAEGKEWDCVLPVPVHQRANKSYQEWIIRLPVRLGGFGFRSLEDMAGIAFIGALEQAVPALAGEDGICRQLEEVMGGQECFGEDAPADQRWRVMLASISREGEELRRVWANLKQEELEAAAWLDEEVQPSFQVEAQGVGGTSRDGSTRGKLTEERDATRSKMVTKGLEVHPIQARSNRPVWAWMQRDKCSSAWLQALPGPDSSLTSAEFSEAGAAALQLPSPACQEKLGQPVRGREVVDLYGEAVQAAALPGDHWRKRHDKYKMMVQRLCVWAGLDCEVKVFNLFAGSIPQEGLNRMERGRKLQSIVPDLRISLPMEGNMVPRLHEIKMISSCKTRYAPHREGQEATKAVDIRAGQLQQSYVAKARATDQAYCGTPDGTVGPVERKLASMGEVEGLVVGAFGEVSAATHALISHMAVSRVRVARPQLGRRGQLRTEEAEIAIATAFLRRTFSICAVKGQAFSLLGRLEGLGAGVAAAQGRRSLAAQQENLWRRQRQAHALCVRQGRDILRRGQFHLS